MGTENKIEEIEMLNEDLNFQDGYKTDENFDKEYYDLMKNRRDALLESSEVEG